MGIFQRGINKGAYRGRLTCPGCKSEAIRYLENVTPFRLRYVCRKCGAKFQYDIQDNADFIHPYAAYNKKKWRDIVAFHMGAKK